MKRTALTWTLAIAISAPACLPTDPTLDRERDVPVIELAAPAADPSPTREPVVPVVRAEPEKPEQVEAPRQETPQPEVVELPSIPYALADLPTGVSAPWPGRAVHGALVNVAEVTDGDTVKIRTSDGVTPVRVMGINAPECDKRNSTHGKSCDPSAQDFSGEAEFYGVEAWVGLRDFVEGEDVRLACKDVNGQCETDLYGRTLAFLVIDGEDVSERLTTDGLAWTYTQFPPANVYTYCVAEDSAIERGVGIWADGRATAINRMNGDTRRWYAYHDSTCAQHAP